MIKVGKYEITNDNGKLTVLRKGEPWDRNFIGDSFVLALVQEIEFLREMNLEIAKEFYDQGYICGVDGEIQQRHVEDFINERRNK